MMQKIWPFVRRIAFEVYSFLTAPYVVRSCLSLMAAVGGFV